MILMMKPAGWISPIVLTLLFAGIIVAITYVITPHAPQRTAAFEARNEQMAAERAKSEPANSGAEQALRRVIGQIQRGQVDPAQMDQRLYDRLSKQLPQVQRIFTPLGSVKSLLYLGTKLGTATYRVAFANGSIRCEISLTDRSIIQTVFCRPPRMPSAQAYVKSYGALPMRERSKRMAVQFAILVAVAAFGRLALRLRI